MMKVISFAWTTPALVAGHKTVTRRDWQHDYARRFVAGERVQAFNRSPRHGGAAVAIIEIVSCIYESEGEMPDADYAGEGFEYLAAHPDLLPKTGQFSDPERVSREWFDEYRSWTQDVSSNAFQPMSYVIRFRVVELTELGRAAAKMLPDVREVEDG